MKRYLITLFFIVPVLSWAGGFQYGIDSALYPSEGMDATELMVWWGYENSRPLLRGDSVLTENNNIAMKSTLSLSPVSLGTELAFSLTPVAFLVFEQGTHIGTGWSLSDDIVGLGLNRDGMADRTVDSLNGYVLKTWVGAALQFDLAEILPGRNKYAHVVLKTTFRYQYQYYSAAEKDQPWRYQADDGMNFNGFVENTRTILGYMVPNSPLDFAGVLMETENYLGHVRSLSTIDRGGWGSDFMEIHIGPLVNWQMSGHHSLTLMMQWDNGLEYTDETENEEFFMNRRCTGDWTFSFERIVLSYKYKW